MSPNFVRKLYFNIRKTSIKAEKIDSSLIDTFRIVIAKFEIKNKISRLRCFQEIFLVADIKVEVILEIFFLKLNNANMSFSDKTLI